MTVAVTGATGHLGASLVRALLAEGREVRAMTHGEHAALDGLDVERVRADVTEPASLRDAFAGVDVVYNLAGLISIVGSQGGRVERVNVHGARNVAAAARDCGVRRMVHFSSIHAFDLSDTQRTVHEGSARAGWEHPAYDRSKVAGEREVRRVIARGLDAVVVHPVGCIGPHDFRVSRMGRVLIDLYHRRLPALTAGGFHWVDTRDVALGAIAAESRGRTGESYILSGRWSSLKEVSRLAQGVTGVRAPRTVVPIAVAKLGAPFMMLANRLLGGEPLYTSDSLHALSQSRRLCGRKAEKELGFRARPLEDTILDTYRWFSKVGHVGALAGAS